jgi:hypothetical protein
MIKKKLLFILIALFSGFCAYADPWDPDFDGPEPPPVDVSINAVVFKILLLTIIALVVISKNKRVSSSR